MTLFFYLEPSNFPYRHLDNLSIENEQLVKEMAPSTWWSWTLRTYLHFKDTFPCKLVDTMPEEGIIFFFRGSVGFFQKPKPKQFWVCFVADSSWHLYSHINIFQNPTEAAKWPSGVFAYHWPQLGLIPSKSPTEKLENLYFFGNTDNLAKELKSEDWSAFCRDLSLNFHVPDYDEWNDYSNVDISIGIRSFDVERPFNNKPASKMINAWMCGVPFIANKESAYTSECNNLFDAIFITNYQNFKDTIKRLKQEPNRLIAYKQRAQELKEKYTESFFFSHWESIIQNEVIARFNDWEKESYISKYTFHIKRLLYFRVRQLFQNKQRKSHILFQKRWTLLFR